MNDLSSSPTSDFRCMQYFNMNDENQDPDRSKHFNYLTKFEVGLPFSDHTNILYDPEYSDTEWQAFNDNDDSIKEKMPILESINYSSDFDEEDYKLTRAQTYANSLCSVIALPRTFRWVMCEWFYSNLDRPLLLGMNDFRTCLDIRFPFLKTRLLTRGQWLVVKRLIGKPRRSSPKFFYQERKALSEKRQKLRTMERLVSIAASSGDVSLLNMSMHQDLLENLPVDFKLSPRLSPETAVIVRIYQPNPGIFTGIVKEESKVYPNYGVFINSSILMVPSHESVSQSELENNWYGYRIIPDTDVIGIKPPDNLISVADLHAGSTLSDAILSLTEEGKKLIASGQTSIDLRNYYKHTRHIIADQLKNKSSIPVAGTLSPENKEEESLDYSRSKVGLTQATSQLSNSASSQSSNILSSPRHNSAILPYNFSILSRDASVKKYSSSDETSAYSMDFLRDLSKLTRLIDLKTTFVKKLKNMNNEAEERLSEKTQISLEFQHDYATLIVQLDKLKKEITQHFTSIFKYTEENVNFFMNQQSSMQPAQIVRCPEQNFDIPAINRQFVFPGELVDNVNMPVFPTPDGQHFDAMDLNNTFFKVPEQNQDVNISNSNLCFSGLPYPHNRVLNFAPPIFTPMLYQNGSMLHAPNLATSQETNLLTSCNINQDGIVNNQFSATTMSTSSSMSYYPYFCPRPSIFPNEPGMYRSSSAISQEPIIPQLDQTLEWHRKCDEEAAEIIIKSQEIQGHPLINASNFDLISKLMRLLLQIRNLTDTRPEFSEVQSIHNEMKEIKSIISECNIEIFNSDIEQKVNQILSSINQYVSNVNYNPLPSSISSHQHLS